MASTASSSLTLSPLLLLLLLSSILLPILSDAVIGWIPRRYISMNVIDRCWRNNPNWAKDRPSLAMCSVGFCGRMKQNTGNSMRMYEVTDSSDHPTEPKNGTLRYGATMIPGKVWITFKYDMFIKLERPLYISNNTAIDGRGANVHITMGAGFLLYGVHNVIIHGLHFHDIKNTKGNMIAIGGGRKTDLGKLEGMDAIRIVGAWKIWIDHNTLYRAHDGLIDAASGSSRITISNNWFTNHDKVMLLGADDNNPKDRDMRVTLVYNHFGPNCNQRMPRIREGYVHIANNLYEGWKQYAIGGSKNPTIMSEGNRFIARETERIIWKQSSESWHVDSRGDVFFGGAKFKTWNEDHTAPRYGPLQKFTVRGVQDVELLVKDAGALHCYEGSIC